MAIDFDDPLGVDISCVDDLDANLSVVDGRTAMGQAAARRITTPRGNLYYQPDYGIDVRAFIKASGFSATQQARLVEGEALKDPRLLNVAASVELDPVTEDLAIGLQLEDDSGPFDLTVAISALSVELLEEG